MGQCGQLTINDLVVDVNNFIEYHLTYYGHAESNRTFTLKRLPWSGSREQVELAVVADEVENTCFKTQDRQSKLKKMSFSNFKPRTRVRKVSLKVEKNANINAVNRQQAKVIACYSWQSIKKNYDMYSTKFCRRREQASLMIQSQYTNILI